MSESQASARQLKPAAVPRHIAIIMDGNHRWARQRRLPGTMGHRAGARNVRRVVEACARQGVQHLTLFAFSTENWNRPRSEISLLMGLMRSMFENDLEELNRQGIRLCIIGDRSRFSADLQMEMQRAEALTAGNDRLRLNIAANYGGRWDITEAARGMARAVREGRLALEQIDEDSFGAQLSLGSGPPPDLCIRTGGDQRISNFLLWDFAYTELYFADAYWPDFDERCLEAALDAFEQRKRRFGCRE